MTKKKKSLIEHCERHNIDYVTSEGCSKCESAERKAKRLLNTIRKDVESDGERKIKYGFCSLCGDQLNLKGDCERCQIEFGPKREKPKPWFGHPLSER